ncbi:ribonuclease III [Prochlorococcus sp. MIT 1307]|uniref:ribonuclease III n=1 Tax=Prochlorococcus sp. MIT 1307 TaxID=3096219 RepID=UPI002A763051|nr:ribonuclease III [Prochlorococcus sp. MIT 1307]
MKQKTNEKISTKRTNQLQLLLARINIDPNKFVLQKTDLGFKIINEALTHTSANCSYNHERLEFLGDAVLRLAATKFIDYNFPRMTVGDRSALRSILVSDDWLTKVGKNIKIEKVLIIGPKAEKDFAALSTLQAEATEALIGAIYECLEDLSQIIIWLSPYWQEETFQVMKDPYRHNSKSALQEWSQGKGLNLPKYAVQEVSQEHGDPKRFFCRVKIEDKVIGEGWGSSRKNAEKEAAISALKSLKI